MTTVAAIDDDQMLLDGLTAWFSAAPDLRLIATAHTVDELLTVADGAIDVVVLDVVLADRSDPVHNVRRLVTAGHRVLVISVIPNNRTGIEVVKAGAAGYLTKDADLSSLAAAIREAASGGTAHSPELAFAFARDSSADRPSLSAQERMVLIAYAAGMTLAAAARHAGIKPATAKQYLDRVKDKYCRSGRPTYTKLDLARRVREDGLSG